MSVLKKLLRLWEILERKKSKNLQSNTAEVFYFRKAIFMSFVNQNTGFSPNFPSARIGVLKTTRNRGKAPSVSVKKRCNMLSGKYLSLQMHDLDMAANLIVSSRLATYNPGQTEVN